MQVVSTKFGRKLFRNIQKCEHCLSQLPPRKDNDIAPTRFPLPVCNYELHRRSFVVRCLFNCLSAQHACSPWLSTCESLFV